MFILMRRFTNSGDVMKCLGVVMRLSQLHETEGRGEADRREGRNFA
jgi:hypothetical protein